jgi:hypothetical protein
MLPSLLVLRPGSGRRLATLRPVQRERRNQTEDPPLVQAQTPAAAPRMPVGMLRRGLRRSRRCAYNRAMHPDLAQRT